MSCKVRNDPIKRNQTLLSDAQRHGSDIHIQQQQQVQQPCLVTSVTTTGVSAG